VCPIEATTKEKKMKVYTIEKKMSGTGTSHDVASDQFDREIKFRNGTKYAVVLAAYYGDCYSTHKTKDGAVKASNAQTRSGCSHIVIDVEGRTYTSNGYTLVAD
jgi:hypothetical protein